jgi:hypothetical protein
MNLEIKRMRLTRRNFLSPLAGLASLAISRAAATVLTYQELFPRPLSCATIGALVAGDANPITMTPREKTPLYSFLDRESAKLKNVLTRSESLLAMLLVCFANSITLPRFPGPYILLDVTINFSETALIALPMALLIIVVGVLLLVTIAVPRLLHGPRLEAL